MAEKKKSSVLLPTCIAYPFMIGANDGQPSAWSPKPDTWESLQFLPSQLLALAVEQSSQTCGKYLPIQVTFPLPSG